MRRPLPEDPLERVQLQLFTFKRYAYHVIVTNLTLRPEGVWRFYKARAKSTLYVRELKWDYPLGKIPTKSFKANEAYFHLVLFSFSLASYFKRLVLPPYFQKATLSRLRTDIFLLAAQLVKTHNRNILKLPRDYVHQDVFEYAQRHLRRLRPL